MTRTAYILIIRKGKEHTIKLDVEDYMKFKDMGWRIHRTRHHNTNKFYARKGVRRDGKRVTTYLHRVVMNALPRFVVDHINGDGLDNRKRNLKVTTQQENASARRQSHSKECPNNSEHKSHVRHKAVEGSDIEYDLGGL